jgi:hypothetical protein
MRAFCFSSSSSHQYIHLPPTGYEPGPRTNLINSHLSIPLKPPLSIPLKPPLSIPLKPPLSIPLKNSIMSSDTVYKSDTFGAFAKLNGDNFPAWKAAMVFHLGAQQGNLLAIITGEEPPPPENHASLEAYQLRQHQEKKIPFQRRPA